MRIRMAVALGVAGCVMLAVSLPSIWLRAELLNTDRYLAAVGPLAGDRGVQDLVAIKAAAAINRQLDASRRVREALPPQAQFLAGAAAELVDRAVERAATELTRSAQFRQLWLTVNRLGHQELVRVLSGKAPHSTVVTSSGRIRVDLGPVVEAVKASLATAGFPVVSALPRVSLVVEFARIPAIRQLQTAMGWLNLTTLVAPVLAVSCLAGSVLIAPRRRKALILLAAAVFQTVVALLVALQFLLQWLAASAALGDIGRARSYLGQLTSMLRDEFRVVGGLALAVVVVVAAAPWLAAVTASVRRRLQRSRSGVLVSAHPTLVRAGLVAGAGSSLVVRPDPGVRTILWTGAALITALGLLQLVVTDSGPGASEPMGSDTGE